MSESIIEPKWPSHVSIELLREVDALVEAQALMLDEWFGWIGLDGDWLRALWRETRPAPSCDCHADPRHRWDCRLTPIWSKMVAEFESTEAQISPSPDEYFAGVSSPYTLDSLWVIHCWRCRHMHPLGSCRPPKNLNREDRP